MAAWRGRGIDGEEGMQMETGTEGEGEKETGREEGEEEGETLTLGEDGRASQLQGEARQGTATATRKGTHTEQRIEGEEKVETQAIFQSFYFVSTNRYKNKNETFFMPGNRAPIFITDSRPVPPHRP